MAAPTYGHDLQTYNDCTSVTGWAEVTNMTQTNGDGEVDGDLAIYGTVCISEAQRKTGLGSLSYTGTGPTLPTDGVFLIWFKSFAPNSLGTEAQGGIRMLVGSSTANYYGWYVNGSDTYPYGGWINYAIDPTNPFTGQTQGSPTGVYNTVGVGINSPTTTPSKGNSHTVDIIRYGRATSYFANGDLANGYATFSGFSYLNDNPTTGRWGLIQAVAGGYLFKGKMSFGSGTTAVDFRDSLTKITIDNTKKVSSTFNRIEVNVATSRVDLTRVNFVSLSTVSKGDFEMVDNATVNIDSCSFTDMGTFLFQSGATLQNATFRRTEYIVQSGATFDACVFANVTGSTALYVDDLSKISNCSFTSDGTGHGMELNSNHAGNFYTLTDFTYEDYATGFTGTTGNEAIYNNSGGHVQLTVDGGDTPSIRNGSGASTEFVFSSTLSFTVIDVNGNPLSGVNCYIDDDNESPFIMNQLTDASGVSSTSWTGGEFLGATWRVRKYGYKPYLAITDVPATGTKDIPVTLIVDRQQT